MNTHTLIVFYKANKLALLTRKIIHILRPTALLYVRFAIRWPAIPRLASSNAKGEGNRLETLGSTVISIFKGPMVSQDKAGFWEDIELGFQWDFAFSGIWRQHNAADDLQAYAKSGRSALVGLRGLGFTAKSITFICNIIQLKFFVVSCKI